ncbi:polysaccharide deacetylase family protein [Sandarakinorhabdus sp.]|uniref:polysaccharide deacetylase family protein n=1 Tax=Sandarakinorhabdus sp. TaxID=1916663 RepID=UPI00286DE90A|nr:polysaccharide deacetylase family protein [Sandarakinorhabdus sp.]
MTRRLLASIHDVSPRFEREVDILVERLERRVGPAGFAMLVVPDHWDQAPIAGNAAFGARLRGWADQGTEMFLHGWRHRDDAPRGFAARHMTAGEGEFAHLDEAGARERLRRGRGVIENAIGRPVAGFIAPAWLYGAGAHAAIRAEGFALAEDHMKVWEPASGRVLARGPVITWASRSPGRIRSSLMFAGLARHGLALLPNVRVAVHPGDTGVPALLHSLDATLAALMQGRSAGRYAELLVR